MAKKARTRANNGMGSVRQRKDGLWEARYTSPDGRQRSVYAKTEAEVTKKLRGALHELDTGAWREPSRMTVREWSEIWLRDWQTHAAPGTVYAYEYRMRVRVLPVIGDVRLTSLTGMHVRRVVSAMVSAGMSARYTKCVHTTLSVCLSAAVEAGLIKDNPAEGVKTPRAEKTRLTIVDRENIPAFVEAAKEYQYGRAIIYMLMTGLRLGELLGLGWDDISLDAAQMDVRRQLIDRKTYAPPKDGSTRMMQLTPEAVDLLREQRRAQLEAKLAAGPDWVEGVGAGLVFRTRKGLPVTSDSIYNQVCDIGRQIGLDGLHPHDLRHSYAVAALRSGVDIKTVQHNLGHRSASMTLDVYAAYTTDAGRTGASKMSLYWQEAVKGAKQG